MNELSIPPVKRGRPLLWAAIALPLAGWAALAMGAATPLKGVIERKVSAALGRTVSIGGPVRIVVTPFSIRLDASELRIANPDWAKEAAFLHAGRASARIATFDLFIGAPGLRAVALRDGTLDLERSADGRKTNWSGGKAGSLLDLAAIRHVAADGMTLHYRDPSTKTHLRLALADGGHGRIDVTGGGAVGERDFTLTGTARAAQDGPTRIDLRARAQDVALHIEGMADAPFRLGTARLSARAQGENFARLAAWGDIALPAMPDYDITARIGHAGKGWHFSHIDGRIGRTDLAGKLTLSERRGRPLIAAELSSRELDAANAMALLSLGDGDMSEPRLLPDAPLSAGALNRFDAVVDYRADRVAGLRHAPGHLSMKLALARGMLRISPASVDLAGGFVSTDLSIDARRSPALVRTDIRLSPTPMGRLLAGWGVARAGTTAMVKGRIQLSGRGDTLREALGNADGRIALVMPAGDVRTQRASASSLDMANLSAAIFREPAVTRSPTSLNCGLIAFTVRDGMGTADPILIDTDGHVLSGRGRLDLHNESLDLKLEAQGKSFSWFGRPSPVLIGGTLAEPIAMRDPVSWFRPASFFGLSMLLPDLKSIFGFVDPEDAQAPACGPILSDSTTSAQRERGMEIAALP